MDVENSSLILMSSPILLLLPIILILSSSINVCNARQLGFLHKGFCKNGEKARVVKTANNPEKQMKSSSAEIKMQQERSLEGEITIDRGACIEKQKDVAMNDTVRGSGAVSGANRIRSLYTVSSGIAQKKAEEREPEFHFDYSGPKTHPPIHN